MTKRKTMTDALSPEKEAFIKGNYPQDQEKQIEERVVSAPPTLGRRGRVALTVRLETDVVDALYQASAQRKLEQLAPYTQQDIIGEALKAWLRESGFWPREG